ncbi:MAG TPA: hypothetical protein VFA39_06520 [Steroidobacteraceae bacterium]|nr:hypothetical protein [Steroidobacteraceae bacterium]
MSALVSVPSAVVNDTLQHLRRAGGGNRELVVAWHGKRSAAGIAVTRLSIPEQIGTRVSFRVSDEGMRRLRAELAAAGELVAAQIHAHPAEAFHSLADDRGALVGHLGALSIVLPEFAAQCSVANFTKLAAVFALHGTGRWREVSHGNLDTILKIV